MIPGACYFKNMSIIWISNCNEFEFLLKHASFIGFHNPATGVLSCTLHWRHNERDDVSNHRCLHCLLNALYAGNSPVTGELPSQKASNSENACIWWRHYELLDFTHDVLRIFISSDYMSCLSHNNYTERIWIVPLLYGHLFKVKAWSGDSDEGFNISAHWELGCHKLILIEACKIIRSGEYA